MNQRDSVKKNPLLSVIIPTYNSGETLGRALESVLQQTFSGFEIVIIDGFSTDKTLQIAKRCNDKRIKIWSERDDGIYDAMNKGIKRALGKWIYFMGSDDSLLDEHTLGKVANQLDNNSEKIIYGNVLIKGDCGWAKDNNIYDGEFNIPKLFRKNISHQAMFFQKSIFDKIGYFNIEYKICADFEFNLRAASKFRMKYINLTIAEFSAGGVSTLKPDDQFVLNYDKIIFKYYKRKLLASYMRPFFFTLIPYGKQKLKEGSLFDGLWYLMAGYYQKVVRKLFIIFMIN